MSKSELLEVYLERSSIQEKRLFACTLCPYRTDRRNNLKRHTATMHEQSTAVLECCGSRFANKAALRHHTAAYHRHGYICTICARVFCRRALLRRHHAVHSGLKEFTCTLCDYATSHKSNLERHMKIHESGDKFPSSSPSSTGQSVQNDCSSPDVDFFNPGEDLSKSYCVLPPSRDHNPILASLLSQPAHDGEVVQWIYHSPYDSYSSQMLNPQVGITAEEPNQHATRPERRWSYDSTSQESLHGAQEAETCGVTRFESSSASTILKEPSTLPLRHAIDVILGVKEELPRQRSSVGFFYCGQEMSTVPATSCVVTTASNHWSVGHLSSSSEPCQRNVSPVFVDVNASQNSHEPNSQVESESEHRDLYPGYKRPWQTSLYHPSHLSENLTSMAESEEAYVPKKLRMSKRYQSSL